MSKRELARASNVHPSVGRARVHAFLWTIDREARPTVHKYLNVRPESKAMLVLVLSVEGEELGSNLLQVDHRSGG
jgi:hypothetical protein